MKQGKINDKMGQDFMKRMENIFAISNSSIPDKPKKVSKWGVIDTNDVTPYVPNQESRPARPNMLSITSASSTTHTIPANTVIQNHAVPQSKVINMSLPKYFLKMVECPYCENEECKSRS